MNEKEVKVHQGRHGKQIFKICDTCGKMFTVRSTWDRHKQLHDAEKKGNRCVCKICGRSFTLQAALKFHLKKHSKDRPHGCEVCGKTFKESSSLDKHRPIHTGIKHLSCEYCGKGFSRRDNLKSHLRTHTREKPFECDVCDAAFTHNVSLKTHKRSAHGIDMWKDQKSQVVEEFDDFNLQNPQLHEKQENQDTNDTEEKKLPSLKDADSQEGQNQISQRKIRKYSGRKAEDSNKCKSPTDSCSLLPVSNPQTDSTPMVTPVVANFPPSPGKSQPLVHNLHDTSSVSHDGKEMDSGFGEAYMASHMERSSDQLINEDRSEKEFTHL